MFVFVWMCGASLLSRQGYNYWRCFCIPAKSIVQRVQPLPCEKLWETGKQLERDEELSVEIVQRSSVLIAK